MKIATHLAALLVLGVAVSNANAAVWTWTGGHASSNNISEADNWAEVGSPSGVAGDLDALLFTGTPARTTANNNRLVGNSNTTSVTFSDTLSVSMVLTGALHFNNPGSIIQDSNQSQSMAAPRLGGTLNIGGSGNGNLVVTGTFYNTGQNTLRTVNVNNPGFAVTIGAMSDAGHRQFDLTKQGAGKLTLTGASSAMRNTTVTGGTVELGSAASFASGLSQNGLTQHYHTMLVNGGTFQSQVGGAFNFKIDGVSTDVITLSAGTLDISNLTLNINPVFTGITEDSYVLVDYSAGGTLLTASNLATGNTFYAATNVPTGYIIVNDTANSQILMMVPEPGSLALLAAGSLFLLPRRERAAARA